MKKILKTKRGFTLIELLVVIGIIGILATIGAVSFGSARAKARTAKRIGDLRSLQSAIEVQGADQNAYVVASPWSALLTAVQASNINVPADADAYCYYGNTATLPTAYTLSIISTELDTLGEGIPSGQPATAYTNLIASTGSGACNTNCGEVNYCLSNTK